MKKMMLLLPAFFILINSFAAFPTKKLVELAATE
jgi:hypothetical protein